MRILVFPAIVALAGCTNVSTHGQADVPEHKPGMAVAYFSNSDAEYRQAAQRAQEWCHENYDAPATYLSQRHDESAGNIVTFGCAADGQGDVADSARMAQ